MSFETATLILAFGAIALLAFAMAGLLRQVRALTMLVSGEGTMGGPAPGQRLPRQLAAVQAGGDALFVFMDSDCPSCDAIAPEVARLRSARDLEIRLVFRGAASSAAATQNGSQSHGVLEGMSDVFRQFPIPATPFAVRAGADAVVIDAGPVGSPKALQRFVANRGEEQAV